MLKAILAGLFFSLTLISSASAANLSRSYHTTSAIPQGYLVSLVPGKSGYVEPANTDNGSTLLGVIVTSNDTLLEVGSYGGSELVAINGTANALASSINGKISPGDQVSVSPFNGIGAKALPGSKIIGIAQSSLNSSTQGAERESVKDNSGHSTSIIVGYIKVSIGVGTATSNSSPQNGLQRAFTSLTGHVISTARILVALGVAVITLVILIVLMYASIYGSVISIGRNPLAKNAVLKSLSSVLLMAIMIFLIGAVAVVFLLR